MPIKRVTPCPENFVDAVFVHGNALDEDYGDPEIDLDHQLQPIYPKEGHALLANNTECAKCPGLVWSANGIQAQLDMKDGSKVNVVGWVKFTYYAQDQMNARDVIEKCLWERVKPGIFVGYRKDLT